MEKKITLPITEEAIADLKAGDSVLLTGTILTGRDAAHKRLFELIEKGEPLPVEIKGELIYYVGPAPAKPGCAVGPAGPTSSYRMDKYAPALLDLGLKGMYEDLGTEAVRRYTVEDFPCIVAIDSEGNNVYETEPVKYREC